MKPQYDDSITEWAARHALLVWLGILLNVAVAVPLLLEPEWLLAVLGIPLHQLVWGQFAGLLLILLSLFYIPATIDLGRYRANAWLAVFPSRTAGTLFFFLAVFAFDQPAGFLLGALVDGSIGLATLYCLIRIRTLERAQVAIV